MNEKTVINTATEAFKLVGSLGGLIYLVTLFNLWRNRVRVKVRILSESEKNEFTGLLRFEAQNVGSAPTSIEPRIAFSGFLPRPHEKMSWRVRMPRYDFDFIIHGTNRTLHPHVPLLLEAQSENTTTGIIDRLGFMFFKTYRFSFTRGRTQKIRIYSADGARLNPFQYWAGRLLVKVIGIRGFRKPEDKSKEVGIALSR
jgi:hypothetical protein